jgi:prepilin-type N-terminal cleavage/methylation domain-containing protein
MKPERHNGFTLPEVLIALTLSGVAITAVALMFIFTQKGIQAGVANFELAKEMRVVRENIVRGLATDAGIRSATWSNMTVGAITANKNALGYNVDTNLWPVAGGAGAVHYSIGVALGLNEYQTLPSSSTATLLGSLISSNVTLQSIIFSLGGNVVTAQVTLAYSTAGKTYTKSQAIVTRIPNP